MGHEIAPMAFPPALPLPLPSSSPFQIARTDLDLDLDLDLEEYAQTHRRINDVSRAKARSLTSSMKRKVSASHAARPIRKTVSERLLHGSASFPPSRPLGLGFPRTASARATETESKTERALELEPDTDSSSDDQELTQDQIRAAVERSAILQRADEILRRKQWVGVQVGDVCPICLCDDVDARLTACGHRVHARCITRWLASRAQCPVCRENVTGIEDAFETPSSAAELEKDITSESGCLEASMLYRSPSPSPSAAGSPDRQQPAENPSQILAPAHEWGWFEDFDMQDTDDEGESAPDVGSFTFPMSAAVRPRRTSLASDVSTRVGVAAPLMSRVMSTNFEVCRTFAPLDEAIDVPYADSAYAWIRALPPHRHVSAQIKIRCFRVVQSAKTGAQYAEYRIELTLNGRSITKWRRYSALQRVVNALPAHQYQRTHAAWAALASTARWFNRLEVKYLDQRCRMLEDFAHEFLLDSTSAHLLGDLLEA